jgi:hypothetical protein
MIRSRPSKILIPLAALLMVCVTPALADDSDDTRAARAPSSLPLTVLAKHV